MKDLKTYITEGAKGNWMKIAKKLSKKDKEWIEKYAIDTEHNNWYSMEELEQRCWKGDLKDTWETEYDYLVNNILKDSGITVKDIIYDYSLARSGKQSKIEVFAQAIYMINTQL